MKPEDVERIHEASLRILDEVGVRFEHDGIVERLWLRPWALALEALALLGLSVLFVRARVSAPLDGGRRRSRRWSRTGPASCRRRTVSSRS